MSVRLENLLLEDLDPDNPAHRDPDFIKEYAEPILRFIARHYFRLDNEGIENLPREGPLIVVANHGGGPILPDVWMMAGYWWGFYGIDIPAYALVHDLPFRIPVLRNALIKVGALRASRQNAAKVLEIGGVLLVFPGGESEAQRSFWQRDKIDFRGRTGFIEVALERGVPILPVVNVGGHEVYFTLFSSRLLARLTGLERLTGVKTLPLNVGLPWGVWLTGFLPYLPLPSKIVHKVGKPLHLPKDPKLAKNPKFVREVYTEITRTMQKMLDGLAAKRSFPVLG
jgi:1-acyl-sn-glycerol-3-phosphate acyltransferase